MGDYPTLRPPWQFSVKISCGTKNCLVDKEEVESEPEVQVQEEETSEIYTTESSYFLY
jgi:hypothetical protein